MAIYTRVTTENKENLPVIIAGKPNHPMMIITAFYNCRAIFAGDDRRRQTIAEVLDTTHINPLLPDVAILVPAWHDMALACRVRYTSLYIASSIT